MYLERDDDDGRDTKRKKGNGQQAQYDTKQMMKEKLQQEHERLREAMMSEQQKNQKVVEEVLGSKTYEQEMKVKEIEKEILKEL